MPPLTKIEELDDEALMLRAKDGDTEAFARLYDRHAERAFRVARAVCRDRNQAEDAVQEGFLAIWRSRDTFSPDGGSFRAWSMRIVRNRAIDSVRGAATRPPPQFADEDAERPRPDLESARRRAKRSPAASRTGCCSCSTACRRSRQRQSSSPSTAS